MLWDRQDWMYDTYDHLQGRKSNCTLKESARLSLANVPRYQQQEMLAHLEKVFQLSDSFLVAISSHSEHIIVSD